MLNKEMAKIDWKNKTANDIKNLVRGLNPIMGAYTFLDGKKIKFWKVQTLTENELLEKINKMGIGPGGLGGTQTALAVNVETYPTHIAGLPVAINICCHVNRHVTRTI